MITSGSIIGTGSLSSGNPSIDRTIGIGNFGANRSGMVSGGGDSIASQFAEFMSMLDAFQVDYDEMADAAIRVSREQARLAYRYGQAAIEANVKRFPSLVELTSDQIQQFGEGVASRFYGDLSGLDPNWRDTITAGRGSLEDLDAVSGRYLEDVYPEIMESAGELAAGELPADVIAGIERSNAHRALQGMGTVAAPRAAYREMRDLGLTTMQGIEMGQNLGAVAANTGQALAGNVMGGAANYGNLLRGFMPPVDYATAGMGMLGQLMGVANVVPTSAMQTTAGITQNAFNTTAQVYEYNADALWNRQSAAFSGAMNMWTTQMEMQMAAARNRSNENVARYGMWGNIIGGAASGCCFIFLEARYGDGTMDRVVRRYRDEHMTARNRRGYYKLAQVLVPAMRKSRLAKWIVRVTMTDPLVEYGKYIYEGKKLGKLFTPIKNFWMKVFDYLGQDHPFVRETGEVV